MNPGSDASCVNNQVAESGCSKASFLLCTSLLWPYCVYITCQVNDCNTLPACVASVSKCFKVRELIVFLAV